MGRPQEVSPKNGVADDDDVRKIFVMSKAELVAMRKSLKLAQKESATKKGLTTQTNQAEGICQDLMWWIGCKQLS